MNAALPIGNRQSAIGNSSDWLSLVDAAALLGVSEGHARRMARAWSDRGLARLEVIANGASNRQLAIGNRQCSDAGRPGWLIHRSAHPRLRAPAHAGGESEQLRESLETRYPKHLVERAYEKLHWLHEWRRRCAMPRAAGRRGIDIALEICEEAKKLHGLCYCIAPRTLQTWWAAYNAVGADGRPRGLEALIDQYVSGPSRDREGAVRSPESIDFFTKLMHSQAGHSMHTCHRNTLHESRQRRWSWPSSYSATRRWWRKTNDLAETIARRDGVEAYTHAAMPHLEIDYTVLQPGEQYVIDHTRCDFWVTDASRAREEAVSTSPHAVNASPHAVGRDSEGAVVQFRPWLTAMIDARSRRIVGWHLARTPHQDGILRCFRMAFLDCAVPARLHMDNGADFLSALITGHTKREQRRLRSELGKEWREAVKHQQRAYFGGVLAELGIQLVAAIRKSPWSKGLIERWFGRFEDQCGKSFPTYCGRSTEERPDCLEEIRCDHPDAVPTMEDCRARVGEWIDLYNLEAHRGEGMDEQSPMQVWKTATRLRRALAEQLIHLLQARGVYRVHANGVRLKVASMTVGYGAGSPALRRLFGRDVFLTLDPDDVSYCCAFTADRRSFLGKLDCNIRIPANTPAEQLREAIRKVRRSRNIMEKARREAPRYLMDAAQVIASEQHSRLTALRATGTDDHRPNIVPVTAGFEGGSVPVLAPSERHFKVDIEVDLSRLEQIDADEPVNDVGPVWDRFVRMVEGERGNG
jgi:hypothetical protein